MGELYSLGAAVAWALALILLKKSVEQVPPFALNLFRVVVSIVLFGATFAVMGQAPWRGVPLRDALLLLGSGVVGIAISDTLFHKALDLLGAGLTAIVDCLYSPFVVLLALLFLDERISPLQLAGMVLVIAGILVASWEGVARGAPRGHRVAGVACGAAAMLTVAIGIVMVKPVLGQHPIVWATAVRQVGALAVLLPAAAISPRRRLHLAPLRPQAHWRHLVPGALLSSYVALMLWIGGMKYTQAGVAAIINQSSTIFVLLLAAPLLHEPFTRRKAAACAVALGGIALVTAG